MFTDLFKPGVGPAEHLANLGRARKLLREVLTGLQGLSTKARMQWWSEHIWPTDLPIYTVATAMPDATVDAVKSPLLDLPAFGGGTPDYKLILRPGFYAMRAASSGALANDSQVVTLKEQIKPALVAKWNPLQREFPTHFMGIMGTHHWGVAFPNALQPALGGGNPFPRRAFAEAMGAFLLDPG